MASKEMVSKKERPADIVHGLFDWTAHPAVFAYSSAFKAAAQTNFRSTFLPS